MQKESFIEYEYEKLSHLFNEKLILLVTVTDVEIEETRSKLTPLDGYTGVIMVYKIPGTLIKHVGINGLPQFFGHFGNAPIVVRIF